MTGDAAHCGSDIVSRFSICQSRLAHYSWVNLYAKNLGVNIKGTSHGYGTSFKYSFCVYRGICRTDFFRRDCSAAFGKAVSFQYKADLNDSGMFLRRKCILLIL